MKFNANITSRSSEGELTVEDNISFDICFDMDDDGTVDEDNVMEAFFTPEFEI